MGCDLLIEESGERIKYLNLLRTILRDGQILALFWVAFYIFGEFTWGLLWQRLNRFRLLALRRHERPSKFADRWKLQGVIPLPKLSEFCSWDSDHALPLWSESLVSTAGRLRAVSLNRLDVGLVFNLRYLVQSLLDYFGALLVNLFDPDLQCLRLLPVLDVSIPTVSVRHQTPPADFTFHILRVVFSKCLVNLVGLFIDYWNCSMEVICVVVHSQRCLVCANSRF